MAEKIFIIDDDLDTLRLVSLMLHRNGYEILAASNGMNALGCKKQKINPIIVNRICSETQMNWTYVQERLEYPAPVMITSSPEVIFQANRKQTTAVAQSPDSSMAQQFKQLADLMIEFSTQNQ